MTRDIDRTKKLNHTPARSPARKTDQRVSTKGRVSYVGILVCHGLLNCLSTRVIGWISGISTIWHMLGTVVLIILIPAVAPTHQSGSYVFTEFVDWETEGTGITNNGCEPLSIFLSLKICIIHPKILCKEASKKTNV